MEPRKASKEVQWGRGDRSSSAGPPDPQAGLALWAPGGWASPSWRAGLPGMQSVVPPGGSRDLEMSPRACAVYPWKEAGFHPDSGGFTFGGAATEAGLSARAPASGLWEFSCLCFTAPR